MVVLKPNPFPAMSIAENVTAGLKLTGTRVRGSERTALVEECLTKAGLWKEVRDGLGQPGGALSGGQQQRLCIVRSLAVRPDVLLMDEPVLGARPDPHLAELITEHALRPAYSYADEFDFGLSRILDALHPDELISTPTRRGTRGTS